MVPYRLSKLLNNLPLALLSNFFLVSVLLLVPIVSNPNIIAFEQLKVIIFIFLVVLSGILWLLKMSKTQEQIRLNLSYQIAGFWLIILTLGSVYGLNLNNSLLGINPYYQGLICYAMLVLFSLMVSHSSLNLKRWIWVILTGSVLVSLVAIIEWLKLNLLEIQILNYSGRVISTFGQPNFYSGFLLMTVPLNLWLLEANKSHRKLITTILAINILAIFLSYSRIVIIMLLVLLLWQGIKKIKKRLLRVSLVAVTSLMILVSGAYLIGEEFISPYSSQWLINNSPEKRVYIWTVLIDSIKERPFLGYGLENIPEAYRTYFSKVNFNTNSDPTLYSLKDLSIDRSHNYFLDLLIFGGVGGLVLWLLLILRLFWLSRKTVYFSTLLVYFVWVSFQNQSIVHLVYFWWLVGMIEKEISI